MNLKKAFTIIMSVVPLVLSQNPELKANQDISEVLVAQDPTIVMEQLDNGFTYAIMKNSYPPERVSIRLMIRAGSLMEQENERGMAHYLEHLAFGGSKHFAPGTLINAFQKMGMNFGGDTNAYTSFDRTVYMLELPSGNKDTMKEALTIMSDYADGLLLQEDTVEKERGIILSEKRDRDTVEFRQIEAQYSFVLKGSLIPDRFPIGKEDVIKVVKAADFRRFYNMWYRPDLMTLVIAGNVDPSETKKMVTEMFSSMKNYYPDSDERCGNGSDVSLKRLPQPPENPAIVTTGVSAKVHREQEASRITVSIMTVRPYVYEGDTYGFRREDTVRYMAYSMLQKRLSDLSEKEGSTFLGAYAYSGNMLNYVQTANVSVISTVENWKDAVCVAEQELRRVLEFGFNNSELAIAKANILSEYERLAAGASTRENPDLANGIIDAVYEGRRFSTPQTDLEIVKEFLSEVTAEECLKMFSEDWTSEKHSVEIVDSKVSSKAQSADGVKLGRRIFVVGNFFEDVTDATVMEVYKKSENETLTKIEEKKVDAFAYQDFGVEGKVASQDSVKDLSIDKIVFENGIHLVIKKSDFQANRIMIRVRVGNGLLDMPKDKTGMKLYLEQTFIDGGLEKHSSEDLRQIFAGKNVGATFRVDNDSYVIEGATTPEDLLAECQFLTAYTIAPGFREESERVFKRNLPAMYLKLNQSAEGVWQKNGLKYILDNDFRFGLPEEKEVSELSNAQAKQFITPVLIDGSMEIAVVGDCNPDTVIKAVAKTFGALNKRNALNKNIDGRAVSIRKGGNMKVFEYPSELPRSMVVVSWHTADSQDIVLHRQLSLLSSIVDDRLRVELREALGEAYSPHATRFARKTFPGLGFQLAISLLKPEQTDTVAKLIQKIGNDMAENGVSQDEFDRALNPLLTEVRASIKSNPFWMETVSNSSVYPDQINNSRTLISEYEGMKIEDMNMLAQRYLKTENSNVIIMKPKAGK